MNPQRYFEMLEKLQLVDQAVDSYFSDEYGDTEDQKREVREAWSLIWFLAMKSQKGEITNA